MASERSSSELFPQTRLDFLRGIAAFYVVLNHARGSFWIGGEKLLAMDPSPANYLTVAGLQITSLGEEAVTLFFVLSGFAMAHSVRVSNKVSIFYGKRILRIWPPYIGAVVLALLVGFLVGDASVRARFWSILFYVQPGHNNIAPQFWSLPYEVIFYFFCPVLLRNIRSIYYTFAFSICCLLVTLAINGPQSNQYGHILLDFFGTELFLFLCGSLCYYHLDRIPALKALQLTVAVLVMVIATWMIKHALGANNFYSNFVVILLSLLLIKNLKDIKKFNLGYFSYSIYLAHYAFVVLISYAASSYGIKASSIENPFAWLLTIPVILGACYCFYLVTERLSNQLVRRLREVSRER